MPVLLQSLTLIRAPESAAHLRVIIRQSVVSAIDRRVKCVVSQVMTIDGGEAGRRRMPGPVLEAFRARVYADMERRAQGLPPERVPVAEPGSASMKYLVDSFPDAGHPNSITLLSRELAMGYRPGMWVEQIAPTPLLMILAGKDELTPVDLQLAAYERAGQPKKLVVVEGAGHYEPYIQRFEESSGAALAWFTTHLLA